MINDERALAQYRHPAQFMHLHGRSGKPDNWKEELGTFERGHLNIVGYIPPDKYPKLFNLGANWKEQACYKELGYDCTAIVVSKDVKEEMEEDGFKVIRNDMCEMVDIPNGSADAIVSIQALEHVFYPWKAMLEIYRVLRVGGRFMIDVPVWHPPGEANKEIPIKAMADLQHCSIQFPCQMKVLSRCCGFKILDHFVLENRQTLFCEKQSIEEIRDYPKDGPLCAYYNLMNSEFLRQYCEI